MAATKCRVCKKKFYVKPSHLRKGWGKYCSIICRTVSQLRGKTVSCSNCGRQVYRSPKDIRNSKSGKFFCGKSCQTIWRNKILYSGENHSNWKHGESAYRRILSDSNQDKHCMLCNIADQRLLVVHHKDFNRKNNKIANLVWVCLNCHFLIHHDKILETDSGASKQY